MTSTIDCVTTVNWSYDTLDCSLNQYFVIFWTCDSITNGNYTTGCETSATFSNISTSKGCDIFVSIANCAGVMETSTAVMIETEGKFSNIKLNVKAALV